MTPRIPSASVPSVYHPDMVIDGATISFAHLQPRPLKLFVQNLARELTIDVKFSNHCFSESFDPNTHPRSWLIMDGVRERAFCRHRYHLSNKLPGMVEELPLKAVWVTARERNFIYYIMLDDGMGGYPMFFHLRKTGDFGEHLRLFVESAYPMSQLQLKDLERASQKVKFAVLCAKVFEGKPLRFNTRR